MKPSPCEYAAPTTLEDALDLLAAQRDRAAVLAGGQSLVPMMNLRLAAPALLVDIMRIEALQEIRHEDGCVEIGAGVRMTQAERHVDVPLLARALRCVGHPPIRAMGTVCGSVAHADPAAEVPAALLALDGEVVLTSLRGTRVLTIEQFVRSYYTTAREADELLVAVRLPSLRGPCAFAEVTPRLGGSVGEFATCGVAATIERDPDGTVTKARIALFGVAATPVRARSAEELLVGQWPEPGRLTAAAQATAAELSPLADVHAGPAYRRRLSRVLTERALTEMIS